MSLLMDALKRAEKARQAQSTDGSEAPRDPAETQGLTLDPLEMAPSRPAASEPAPPPQPEDSGALRPDGAGDAERRAEVPADDGLSMEPLEETGGLGLDPLTDPEPGRPEPEPAGSGSFSLMDEIDLDDTSATLPSLKAAQASVDDYFDGTRSASLSLERAAIEREEGADTITAERAAVRPDRSAARAVFDAKSPAPRTSRRWASAGFLVLVLLALLCGGVFVYWNEIGELTGTRPGVIATGRPLVVPGPRPAPVVTPAPTPAAVAAFPSPAPAQAGAAQGAMAGSSEAPMRGGVSLGDVSADVPSVSEVLDTSPRVTARAARPVAAEPATEPRPAPAERRQPAASAELPLGLRPGALRDGALAAGSIRISRRSNPAQVPPLLDEGYRAYQSGDDAGARSAYLKILTKDPDHRDAALGLAAVSVREGRWNDAHTLYMQVLTRNPRDSLAMAGLIALTDNVDPGAAESRVKTLLAAEPEAAYLHFTLGNLYARQERWPEAQQAYFDAFRHDGDNADYAFNLAVSLDRLAQRKTALEYYQLALDLATRRPASFDTASVNERIRIMTAAGAS